MCREDIRRLDCRVVCVCLCVYVVGSYRVSRGQGSASPRGRLIYAALNAVALCDDLYHRPQCFVDSGRTTNHQRLSRSPFTQGKSSLFLGSALRPSSALLPGIDSPNQASILPGASQADLMYKGRTRERPVTWPRVSACSRPLHRLLTEMRWEGSPCSFMSTEVSFRGIKSLLHLRRRILKASMRPSDHLTSLHHFITKHRRHEEHSTNSRRAFELCHFRPRRHPRSEDRKLQEVHQRNALRHRLRSYAIHLRCRPIHVRLLSLLCALFPLDDALLCCWFVGRSTVLVRLSVRSARALYRFPSRESFHSSTSPSVTSSTTGTIPSRPTETGCGVSPLHHIKIRSSS